MNDATIIDKIGVVIDQRREFLIRFRRAHAARL